METPILKIQLEGFKHQINMMLTDQSSELQRKISEILEEKIQEDWVIRAISLEVNECITSAIQDLANSYELRRAITEYISSQLQNKLGA